MFQVSQDGKTGRLKLATLPDPQVAPGRILILNAASVISAGTERATLELTRKSLVSRARERPDRVWRILERVRREGILPVISQVLSKIEEPVALGYSSAGTVLAVGTGVRDLKPGDRVASNGPHASLVSVPANLCARVPEGVPFPQAAYGVLASIALQSVRLSHVGLGETVFVIGLGLIGQIAVTLLRLSGVRVVGTDPDPWKCELARKAGAEMARPGVQAADIHAFSGVEGADAVLICASTPSNEPVELAGEAVRKKGRVVAVGAVGLNLPRTPFYYKEAELIVSCSYGPGRYDPDYEERGHDYPSAYVRWTERRNLQAVLDLMGSGRLDLAWLTTHSFPIEQVEKAYEIIETGKEPCLGVVLEYPAIEPGMLRRRIELRAPRPDGGAAVGVLGAGNFARAVLLPTLRKTPGVRLRVLCSPGALIAAHAADKNGFEVVTTDEEHVFGDHEVKGVFVLTRHNEHARQVVRAIEAGKHVFCEKPLALTEEELATVEAALESASPVPLLMVGFNRRFSPAARIVREVFADVRVPLTISVRFNVGAVAADHWTQDEIIGGGRIIGEACHAIDLATYLAGSPPVRVYAASVGGPAVPKISDDQCFITLRHASGSVSSVAYLAGGDRAFPKERVEVFGGGRIAVIDDFREVVTVADGRAMRRKTGCQDKGHRAELEAFAGAISGGGTGPIPWEELRAVTLASMLAVRSLREGIPFEVP